MVAAAEFSLTKTAQMRLSDACAALFQGNQEALAGLTGHEAGQLVALLTRLIANLDRLVGEAERPRRR